MGSRSQLLNTRGVRFLVGLWCLSFITLLSVIVVAGLGTASIIATTQSDKPEIAFTEESTGRELKKGAVTASFTNYRSRDGVFLRRRIEDYGSEDKASNELKHLLAKAETIIEKDKKASHGGKQSSHRAVLRWRRPERFDATLAIVWREGRRVYILESSTLEHLRSFEKQVYP